jgi:hypothetical protein
MAHGDTEQGATIAGAALPAIQGLDDDRARFYYDLAYNFLNEAARRALDAMMKGYEDQSDFAKTYVAQGRGERAQAGRQERSTRPGLSIVPACSGCKRQGRARRTRALRAAARGVALRAAALYIPPRAGARCIERAAQLELMCLLAGKKRAGAVP